MEIIIISQDLDESWDVDLFQDVWLALAYRIHILVNFYDVVFWVLRDLINRRVQHVFIPSTGYLVHSVIQSRSFRVSDEEAALSVHLILLPEARVMIFELRLIVNVLLFWTFSRLFERAHIDGVPVHFALSISFVVQEVTGMYKFVLTEFGLILVIPFEETLTAKLAIFEFAEVGDLELFALDFLHFLKVSHAFSFAVTKVAFVNITVGVDMDGIAVVQILLEAAIIFDAVLFFVLANPFFDELALSITLVIFEPAFEVVHKIWFARLYLAVTLLDVVLEGSCIYIVIVVENAILVMFLAVFQPSDVFVPVLLVDCDFLSISILTVVYLQQQLDERADSEIFFIA